MTPDNFRSLALALPEVEEKPHFGKTDFRVRNKIFASLKGEATGILKLTAEQQDMLAAAEPAILQPVAGGWGTQEWTEVKLAQADAAALESVLHKAWRNVAPNSPKA